MYNDLQYFGLVKHSSSIGSIHSEAWVFCSY